MKILLTNDDGIYAEGIYAMYEALRKIATVTVVAPDSERSSVGHAITLAQPLYVKKIRRKDKFFGYGISGTPADCVKFATAVILKGKPDVVVSGINLGPNEGGSVFYSGTVAAAREAALMGIPSMAISLATFVKPRFEHAAMIGAKIAGLIHKNKLPKGTFLNVNVPNKSKGQIKGIKVVRQGKVPIHGVFRKRLDPNERQYYWLSGRLLPITNDTTVDINALNKNFITVTPIHCDLTDYKFLKQLDQWRL